jgi:anaphase-promoting complex subunit 5
MSQSGRYDEAIETFESIDMIANKSLKFSQYLILCIGIIKLKRAIRMYDYPAPPAYYTGSI